MSSQTHFVRRRNRGFTLVELLISSTIFLLAMGIIMNFIFDINRSGNRTLLESSLEEQLRNSLNRLEVELQEGAEVLAENPDETSQKTTKNSLVLRVPIYTDAGFILADANGIPVSDTLYLEVKPSQSGGDSVLQAYNKKPDHLLLTYKRKANSSRKTDLNKQVIVKDLIPKLQTGGNAGNYDISSAGISTFTYYNRDGVAITPTTGSAFKDISQIKMTLWAQKDFYGNAVSSKKEIEVRLRNWGELPT